MGCQYSQAEKPRSFPIMDSLLEKRTLTVASLNYCGIMNSPFEFYCQEFQAQLKQLSNIFVYLIPKYFPSFNKQKFKWQFGKIDVKFRVGRYSPMFNLNVGIQNGKILSQEKFQQKWQQVFNTQAPKLNLQYKETEKQTMKTYDLLTFHTMLRYVYKIDSFKEAQGKDTERYFQKLKPFYQLSFLNQEKKLKKTIANFSKLEADIFFFQQYSEYFYDDLQKRKEHFISMDNGKDTMIVVKESSFKQRKNLDSVFSRLTKQQQDNLNWAERSSFMCVDNYIIIGAHLTSKEEKNRAQIQVLKKGLVELKKTLPQYEIIVGGDLNSYLPNAQPLSKQFYMYPDSPDQLTTVKKRTMTQGQFHKGEKIVQQSKDKIISTLKIQTGSILYISGRAPKKDSYVPSDQHPFDHFVLVTKLVKKLSNDMQR